jgi:protein phosphatase 1 regulatory subunit 10
VLVARSQNSYSLINCSPALTTLSTSSPQLSYSPPTSNVSQQQASQHHLPLHSQYPQLSSLSIAYARSPPSLASTIPQTTQAQLQPQSPQGTLSPFALHPPQHLSAILPSAFYAATPQSDSPAPPSQSRREAFLNAIQPSLQSKSFSGGARSVQQLVSKIIEYGITEVSSQTRLDIVTKIRDNAGNNYFRAWLENVSAMDITREWLKAGATTNGDNQVLETVMPLLHVCFLCPYSPALSLINFFFWCYISIMRCRQMNLEPIWFEIARSRTAYL